MSFFLIQGDLGREPHIFFFFNISMVFSSVLAGSVREGVECCAGEAPEWSQESLSSEECAVM